MTGTCLHPLPNRSSAATHLVCFPHAGGSVASFRSWNEVVPDMKVWVAKYPGRADRINEPYAESIVALAKSIAVAICQHIDGQVALFGHSMGAVVAFETARFLEKAGVSPIAIFVSGAKHGRLTPEADSQDNSIARQPMSDDELVAQLKEMGGIDEAFLDTPDFREIILPYVRSDGEIFQEYTLCETPTLKCPIVAIVGDTDIHACVFPWANLTDADFAQHTVKGGHFYLQNAPPRAEIQRRCEAYLSTVTETFV